MITSKIVLYLVLVGIAAGACNHNVIAQEITPEALRQMIANQPSFIADYSISIGQNILKFKLAKKGNNYRREIMPDDYKVIILTRPEQAEIALDPQQKTYTEVPDNRRFSTADPAKILSSAFGSGIKFTVKNLGLETVNGYRAAKIWMKFEGSSEEVLVYFVKDLGNVIIKMELTNDREKVSYTMSKVSLEAEDELFQVPVGYKKVDFDLFMSMMRAKVKK